MLRWHDGDVVRKLRDAFEWTLKDLAKKSGVDIQTIHRLEKGQTKEAKRDTLRKLAEAFNLTARELEDAVPRDHEGVPFRRGKVAAREATH
jgi:transcriptional regulator with XRE-family HTH domain